MEITRRDMLKTGVAFSASPLLALASESPYKFNESHKYASKQLDGLHIVGCRLEADDRYPQRTYPDDEVRWNKPNDALLIFSFNNGKHIWMREPPDDCYTEGGRWIPPGQDYVDLDTGVIITKMFEQAELNAFSISLNADVKKLRFTESLGAICLVLAWQMVLPNT